MQRRICESLATLAIAVIMLCPFWAGTAAAQEVPDDVSNVNYYRVNGFDNTVRLVNPTTQPLSGGGFLCAMTYVFDQHEQLQECCGCRVTNDGLRVISTRNDLTKNPLTGTPLTAGGIVIISTLPNLFPPPTLIPSCNPALAYAPTPALRGFITHGTLAEVEFKNAHLTATEISNLQTNCAFIHTNGTGHGICTCGVGDEFAPAPQAGGR